MGKLSIEKKKNKFQQINIWVETAERLKKIAKKRAETLSKYVDSLSKINT